MAVGAVIAGISGSAGLLGMFLGISPPLLDRYTQAAYKSAPFKLPDLGTTIALRFRNKISAGEYADIFKRSGIAETYSMPIFKMSEQLLSIGEYLTLWRRGEIDESKLDEHLTMLRLSEQDIERAKKVSEYFPSPPDLIQFAVREVYSPDIVSKFGQMEDIPEKFISEAAKTGLPKEQAENFWASHWMLPSTGQGFEMLHRDIIDEDTLKLLLRALDVMPYWRDRLIQLSYRPLTRVDVRRMHALGTLDEQAVYDSYRYGGYSPENAKRMTEFTVLYNADDATGLTRASVTKAYKKGLLSRTELTQILKDFKYSDEVVDFWLQMTDLEKELEDIEAQEEDLLRQYEKGAIGLEDVRTQLDASDLPAPYVDQVITKEELKRSAKLKLPTKGDLTDWLELQIIDEKFYSDYMQMLGYEPEDIQLYLTEFALISDTSKRKFLPIKTYQRWFSSEIMNEVQFVHTAELMKYSEEDIGNLILEMEDVSA